MIEKRFWCLEGYEEETSPIVDGKFAPTNGWICNKLNELNDENEAFKNSDNIAELETEIMKLKEENKELKRKLCERNVAKQRRKEYDDFWNEKIKNSVMWND